MKRNSRNRSFLDSSQVTALGIPDVETAPKQFSTSLRTTCKERRHQDRTEKGLTFKEDPSLIFIRETPV